MNLGKTLKDLRIRRGLKQGVLASHCDISVTYLSKIENNKKEPGISTLKKISTKLDVPMPVIFYLSLNSDDIPQEKIEIFTNFEKPFKSFIDSFFFDERP